MASWFWKVEGLDGTWMITTPDEGAIFVMSAGAVQCLASWLVRLALAEALHRLQPVFEVELEAADFLAVYHDGRVSSHEGVLVGGSGDDHMTVVPLSCDDT